jgi:hypothetical protein
LTEKYKDLTKGDIKTISMLHLELSKVLEKIEVGNSIEMSVKSIPVDIILGERTKEGKEVVIFYGYNHFFRNKPGLKGNA